MNRDRRCRTTHAKNSEHVAHPVNHGDRRAGAARLRLGDGLCDDHLDVGHGQARGRIRALARTTRIRRRWIDAGDFRLGTTAAGAQAYENRAKNGAPRDAADHGYRPRASK
jgi:hypothetical protein